MIHTLAPELFEDILEYLPLHDIYFLCRINRPAYVFFSENESFWKQRYIKTTHGDLSPAVGSYREGFILLTTSRVVTLDYIGLRSDSFLRKTTILSRLATIPHIREVTACRGSTYALGITYPYHLQENKDWKAAYDDNAIRLVVFYISPNAISGVGIITIMGHDDPIYLRLFPEEDIAFLCKRIIHHCQDMGIFLHTKEVIVSIREMNYCAVIKMKHPGMHDFEIISSSFLPLTKSSQGMLPLFHINIAGDI